MEILVMHLVKCVMPDPSQIPELVPGQQRVLFVPLVCIRHRRTLFRVRPVVLDPLQIPGQVLGHQRVILVPLACIHHHRTCLRVQTVPPLLTLPLFNAPLNPIKPLQPVTPDIMENLVMRFVKHVVPVPLQILEPALGQQRVPSVSPLLTPPQSNAPLIPIKQSQCVMPDTMENPVTQVAKDVHAAIFLMKLVEPNHAASAQMDGLP